MKNFIWLNKPRKETWKTPKTTGTPHQRQQQQQQQQQQQNW